MRGSKHVAAIVPVSADDLELTPTLTDAQAERFWRALEEERRKGAVTVFEGPNDAVAHVARRVRGSRPARRK
jgi:hypothetical protein